MRDQYRAAPGRPAPPACGPGVDEPRPPHAALHPQLARTLRKPACVACATPSGRRAPALSRPSWGLRGPIRRRTRHANSPPAVEGAVRGAAGSTAEGAVRGAVRATCIPLAGSCFRRSGPGFSVLTIPTYLAAPPLVCGVGCCCGWWGGGGASALGDAALCLSFSCASAWWRPRGWLGALGAAVRRMAGLQSLRSLARRPGCWTRPAPAVIRPSSIPGSPVT